MKKFIIVLGLVLVGLIIYYLAARSRQEEIPDSLTYGLGFTACLFITLIIFNLMQYFKKK